MNNDSISAKLQELFELYSSGALTKQEYDVLKSQIIGKKVPGPITEEKHASLVPPSLPENQGVSYNESISNSTPTGRFNLSKSKIEPPSFPQNQEVSYKKTLNDTILSGSLKLSKPNADFIIPPEVSAPKSGNKPIKIIMITVVILAIIAVSIFAATTYNNNEMLKQQNAMLAEQKLRDDSLARVNAMVAEAKRETDSIELHNARMSASLASTVDSIDYESNVLSVLRSYYSGLQNRDFDANQYFAENIDRFITMVNVTPEEINSYINTSYYKEFVDAKSEIEAGSYSIIKNENGYTIEYIESGTCYRTSKKAYQTARVNVKVSMNNDFKITYFNQYNIIENNYDYRY